MKPLIEPKHSILTIPYSPNGERLEENPPGFTWLPEGEDGLLYKLQVSRDKTFSDETTEEYGKIPRNFYTPDHPLDAGTYYWRYSLDGESKYSYSRIRSFTIEAGAVETPLPSGAERYIKGDMGHPRIWLNPESVEKFKKELEKDKSFCGFNWFYDQSVQAYEGKIFIGEPTPYPGNKRVIPLWRKNYMDCQEALCHIRSLAVGGVLTEDRGLVQQAKEALLLLADWDTDGSTKRDYNDECAFRVAYALAFGYDWLYGELTGEERERVLESLFVRTKQVADHIMVNTRIHYSRYDSHAVRSLSSVIVPCCIAMLGEKEEAGQWLDYAIEYFRAVYTPWGGGDGGWAEGPAYWTTGMAFVTDALNMIKSYLGIDFYRRPFFQKTGDFPLYCNPVDTYQTSFCDQSNLGDYPGHKVAFNIRQFAGTTGNQNYQWYYDQVFQREPEIGTEFYNKGWWDFYYDNMTWLYDYGAEKPDVSAGEKRVAWFRDIGWVAVNEHLKDFDNHIFFLTKSSPYGSISHSQADQNTFVLWAYGEPLIVTSGYYIGFNSFMHREWRRQTKSANTLLIRGCGQYAGMDKVKQLGAKGSVTRVEETDELVYIREDATQAYQEEVPDLISYVREIYEVNHGYFVLVDTVETETLSDIDWMLHSLSPFDIQGNQFKIEREKARLTGSIVYCSSEVCSMTQSDVFEGVPDDELEGLAKQYHLMMKSGMARKHVIVSLLLPVKRGDRANVNVIKDDQGMDIYYYFEFNGETFSLKVDGNARYGE